MLENLITISTTWQLTVLHVLVIQHVALVISSGCIQSNTTIKLAFMVDEEVSVHIPAMRNAMSLFAWTFSSQLGNNRPDFKIDFLIDYNGQGSTAFVDPKPQDHSDSPQLPAEDAAFRVRMADYHGVLHYTTSCLERKSTPMNSTTNSTVTNQGTPKARRPALEILAYPCSIANKGMDHVTFNMSTPARAVFPMYKIPASYQVTCLSLLVHSWLEYVWKRRLSSCLESKFGGSPDFDLNVMYRWCQQASSTVLDPSRVFHPPPLTDEEFQIHKGRLLMVGQKTRVVSIHVRQSKVFLSIISNSHEWNGFPSQRPPLTLIKLAKDGVVSDSSGFVFELLHAIMGKANASYQTILPPDNNFGALTANGSWNGMVGMVKRGEADIGAAGFTITQIRESAIDFTIPYYIEPTAILMPPPKPQSKLFTVFRPLASSVWILTFLMTVACGYIFTLLNFLSRLFHTWENGNVSYDRRFIASLDCLWTLYIIYGSERNPKQSWLRVGLAFPLMAGFVLAAAYNGSLIAVLSVPTLVPGIETLEELANQHEILWTIRKGTSHQTLFEQATSGVYKKIGDLFQQHPEVMSTTDAEGLGKVLTGKFAFIKEKSWLDFAIAEDEDKSQQCRLHLAKEQFFVAGFGMVLPQGAPHLSFFNDGIQRLLEMGVTEKWKRDYWPPPSTLCSRAKQSAGQLDPQVVLDIYDLQGAFGIVCVGSVIGIVVFFGEVFIFTPTRMKRLRTVFYRWFWTGSLVPGWMKRLRRYL